MKKIKFNFLIKILVIFMAVYFASCTKLDEKVYDEVLDTSLINDPANAQGLVNPAYATLRKLNNLWSVFGLQNAGTDELIIPTRGTDWYDNGSWQKFHLHKLTPDHAILNSSWNDIMTGFSRCNTGIYYLKKFSSTADIEEDIVELKFLRAYYVYLINDFWGQTPFREWDESDYSVPPKVMNRQDATRWLITELKEIIPSMKTKSEVPFGRATKAAAQTLLAKIYLNHEVYTGTADWPDVITQCNNVINSSDYSIASDYWSQFQYANPNTEEAIFTIIHNDNYDLGGGGVFINYTLHYSQMFGNYTSLWNGACITKTFWDTWNLTDSADARKYDARIKPTCGFNQGFLVGQQYSVAGDSLKTRDGSPLIFVPEVNLTNSNEAAGIRVVKFAPNPLTTRQFDEGNDFFVFRISDVYLMRAEAELRSGTGDYLADVNAIREKRNATPRTSLTLDDIYNERGYEFYWEGKRRQDMIRFGHYSEAYDQKPATSKDKCLYPIPQSALDVNPNLKQNPSY